jgi:hypothetical protein
MKRALNYDIAHATDPLQWQERVKQGAITSESGYYVR